MENEKIELKTEGISEEAKKALEEQKRIEEATNGPLGESMKEFQDACMALSQEISHKGSKASPTEMKFMAAYMIFQVRLMSMLPRR
jgi:hypothetical protein